MKKAIVTSVLLAGIAGCDCDSRQGTASLERSIVHDTVRVALVETLRSVTHDTIHMVFCDTLRTVVYDTVRTVLVVAPAAPESLTLGATPEQGGWAPGAVTRAQREIRQGRLSDSTLAMLTKGIPQFWNVNASRLPGEQLALIAALSAKAVSRLQSVRWGEAMAPTGHPRADGCFIMVWTTDADTAIVRLDSSGTISMAE